MSTDYLPLWFRKQKETCIAKQIINTTPQTLLTWRLYVSTWTSERKLTSMPGCRGCEWGVLLCFVSLLPDDDLKKRSRFLVGEEGFCYLAQGLSSIGPVKFLDMAFFAIWAHCIDGIRSHVDPQSAWMRLHCCWWRECDNRWSNQATE